MIKKRVILWVMMFTGIVVAMLCGSNINIAITSMAKLKPTTPNRTFVAFCPKNFTHLVEEADEIPLSEVGEYNWSDKEKNILLSSFTWLMGVSQLLTALLSQKWGGKLIFGASNLIVGILACFTPLAAEIGVEVLIVLRVVQGSVAGCGAGVCAKLLISKWVPPDERSKFMSVMAGLYFGVSFSNFLCGWIIHFLGWRYVFYVSGAASITWCVLWHFTVYETPREHPTISPVELIYIETSIGNTISSKQLPIPWSAIFTSLPILVNTLVYVGSNWTMFVFLFYLPTYLQEVHGFPSYKIGAFSSLPYLFEIGFMTGFACAMDAILSKGILSVTNVRKLATFVNTVVTGTMVGCLIFGGCNITIILVFLTLAITFHGSSAAGISANIVDISPNFCSVIFGLQGLLTSLNSFLVSMAVGYFTRDDKSIYSWNKVFVLAFFVEILSGLLFFIFGDSTVQKWNYEDSCPKEENANLKLMEGETNDCSLRRKVEICNPNPRKNDDRNVPK